MATDFFGLSEASRKYVNPYFDESLDPNVQRKIDPREVGAGLKTSGNLAAAFDKAFLTGRGIVKAPKPTRTQQLLLKENQGGLGGAAVNQILAHTPTTAEDKKIAQLNDSIAQSNAVFKDFTTHKDYLDAFSQVGIDPNSIKTRADLDRIAPETKASVFDIVQRTRAFKNQREKSGILDSLPGSLALGLAGLINPGAAIGLGAIAGGLSGKGGLPGAISGGLQGFGIGNFTNKFTSKGTPAGIDPRDVETPDRTPGGRPAPTFGPPGGSSSGGLGGIGGGDVNVPGGTATSPQTQTPAPPTTSGGNLILDATLAGLGLAGTGSGSTGGDTGSTTGTTTDTGGTGTGTGTGSGSGDQSGTEPSTSTLGELSLGASQADFGVLPHNLRRRTPDPTQRRFQRSRPRQSAGRASLSQLAKTYPSLGRFL